MVKPLPKRFNPDLLARDDACFEITFAQKNLKRLEAIILTAENDVRCKAVFSRRKRHVHVRGSFQTVVEMQCQRCLQTMDVNIEAPYELVFVDDEEAAEALPEQFDPVILDENGDMGVYDLFEDEIIMHVPAFPKHSDSALCRVEKTEFGELPKEASEGKPNPFEALKGLRLK